MKGMERVEIKFPFPATDGNKVTLCFSQVHYKGVLLEKNCFDFKTVSTIVPDDMYRLRKPELHKERYCFGMGICPPVVVKPLLGHFFHGLLVWPLVCKFNRGSDIEAVNVGRYPGKSIIALCYPVGPDLINNMYKKYCYCYITKYATFDLQGLTFDL